jgi:hypothetical protein
MSRSLLHIDGKMPIAEKVRVLQRFLGEHYFDDAGFMYSMWFWKGEELRPFRRGDFAGQSVFNLKDGLQPEDYNSHENTAYTSGFFLWSQCLRYQITGEDEALAYAAKAFRSIDQIFKLTEAAGHKGFLCKPYGQRVSTQTSPDQYISVMLGLWAYREIADRATRQRIDHLLPPMADWWREKNYELGFFDNAWSVLPSNVAEFGPGFIALNFMAYRITGKSIYRTEALRILAMAGPFETAFERARRQWFETGKTNWPALLHGCEYDVERRPYLYWFWEGRGTYWLAAAGVDFLLRQDLFQSNLLRHVLANYYRFIQGNIRSDFLCWYWFQTDLERNTCHPLKRPRVSNDYPAQYLMPFNINFYSYQSEVCYGDDTVHIADVALMAHQHAPEFSPGALPLAQSVLRTLDDRHLHHFIDPDGKQVMPEDQWMCNSLNSDSPALTLLTYWRAKVAGVSLE